MLRDRIATLDPKAAARIAQPAAPPSRYAELELDLDLEVDLDEALAEDTASAHPATVDVDDDAELGFEVDLDEVAESFRAGADATGEVASEEATPSISLADDGTFEFEIDPDEISGDGADSEQRFSAAELAGGTDLDSSAAAVAGGTSAAPGTTTSTARIREELEEVEFYIAQEMYDEAESILTRILEIAPNHPSAMLRMGEVQVARGSAPESVPAAGEVRTKTGRRVAGTSERDLGATARFEGGLDLDRRTLADSIRRRRRRGERAGRAASSSTSMSTSGRRREVSTTMSRTLDEVDVEIDVASETRTDASDPGDARERTLARYTGRGDGSRRGLYTDGPLTGSAAAAAPPAPIDRPPRPRRAAKLTPPPAPRPTPHRRARRRAGRPVDTGLRRRLAAAVEVAAGDDLRSARGAGGRFQRARGIRAREECGRACSRPSRTGSKSIFSDFKKGVSATLDKGDVDTRYDLGIAYREMGLFEDAIGEFKICLEAPSPAIRQPVPDGTVRARSPALRRRGAPPRAGARAAGSAAATARRASSSTSPSRSPSRATATGPGPTCAACSSSIRAFRNAVEKLAELEAPPSPVGGFSGRGRGRRGAVGLRVLRRSVLRGRGEPEPTVESFESFDDVVSDVEVTPVEAPPAAPPTPAASEPALARRLEYPIRAQECAQEDLVRLIQRLAAARTPPWNISSTSDSPRIPSAMNRICASTSRARAIATPSAASSAASASRRA